MTDKMPPLPTPNGLDWSSGECIRYYLDDQMHAYARAYADEMVAPLVEALYALSSAEVNEGETAKEVARRVRETARAALVAEQEKV